MTRSGQGIRVWERIACRGLNISVINQHWIMLTSANVTNDRVVKYSTTTAAVAVAVSVAVAVAAAVAAVGISMDFSVNARLTSSVIRASRTVT